jgi:hypothetical protein
MYRVLNQPALRTITCQISGLLTEEEALAAEQESKQIVDSYGGEPHLCLADGRGFVPVSPAAAVPLQRLIKYSREHGTVCCVHLYDSAIARLQAARLAREATKEIDGTLTVEVVSIEEAEQVLREQRLRLRKAAR